LSDEWASALPGKTFMAWRPIPKERWEQLAETAQYNGSELARLCNLSTRQLRRVMRRDLGCAPKEWLNERRLVAARRSLLSGDSVKKVALDLGFKQSSHFCRRFKSFNHMTPSEFVSSQASIDSCPQQITNGLGR
jgi:AraC-like DNA-binding protein